MAGGTISSSKSTIIDNIVGNVDITPTIFDLAGIDIPSTMDGKSLTSLISSSNKDKEKKQKQLSEDSWRDTFLISYLTTTLVYTTFDICTTWEATDSSFEGKILNPPNNNSDGENYFVDNSMSNNWRGLRIINSTYNWVYIEMVNKSWDTNSFENPYFYELYDLNNDTWNMNNIYDTIDTQTQNSLHEALVNYANCKGQSQCP